MRGLGYNDTAGDFVWNKLLDKALEIGLLNGTEKALIEKDKQFTREETVIIGYNALFEQNKVTRETLMGERTFSYFYGAGIMNMYGVELNNEEIAEISKTKEQEYEVFSNEPEKQKELYTKLAKMTEKSISLFEVYLEGNRMDISGKHTVLGIWTDSQDYIKITIDSGDKKTKFWLGYILDGNILRSYSDSMLHGDVFSKVITDEYKKMNGVNPSIEPPIMGNYKGVDKFNTDAELSTPAYDIIVYEVNLEPTILKISIIRTNRQLYRYGD